MARILVADDQRTILLMVEGLLTSRGHAVTTAMDSRDAFDKLNKFPFDMLITDVLMPGGPNGFDLAQTVKKDPCFKDLKVVIMTGCRDRKDVERGIASGADDYVVKPIDVDIFVAKVDSMLASSGKGDKFTVCPTKEPAQWDVNFDIVGVSEIGLNLLSPIAPMAGSKVKLHSKLFDKMGVPPQTLHVVSCEPSADFPNMYDIKVHFVGMTESELQPIRVWIRKELSAQRSSLAS